MINIDNVMNDVRIALEFALENSVDSHVVPECVIEDMVAKVRALVVPAFDEQEEVISKRDMENMQLLGEIDELRDEVEAFRNDETERVVEEEAEAIKSIFNSIIAQVDRKVVEA